MTFIGKLTLDKVREQARATPFLAQVFSVPGCPAPPLPHAGYRQEATQNAFSGRPASLGTGTARRRTVRCPRPAPRGQRLSPLPRATPCTARRPDLTFPSPEPESLTELPAAGLPAACSPQHAAAQATQGPAGRRRAALPLEVARVGEEIAEPGQLPAALQQLRV